MRRIPVRLRQLAVFALAAGTVGAGRAPAPVEPAVPHDIHVSHTRLVLDGVSVVARVRVFKNDLEKALGRRVAADAATQTAFTDYLSTHFLVRADGARLTCRIEDHEADVDPSGEAVWWAIVQCDATRPIKTLGLLNSVMFELFRDQQNLVTVIKAPEDRRRALYFHSGDVTEQSVTF